MQANDREKPVRTPWDRRKSAPSKNAWWLIASLMLLAFSVVPAHAQYSASLQGAVADAQGAMISGAQVTLTDTETNHSFTTTSSASGDFTFNELAPSTYTLVVTRNSNTQRSKNKQKNASLSPCAQPAEEGGSG